MKMLLTTPMKAHFLESVSAKKVGEYFDAAGFRVIVKGFDVERVPMGEHGSMYRVVMQYGLDEDYEDGQVWFTSRPDDIEYGAIPTLS